MEGSGLPLEGVRVVEMTHMVMGPTCGMILAQLGAEVIKVEPPAGDKTRSLGGMGTSFFPLSNRGKRSVVLDLHARKTARPCIVCSRRPTCSWKIFATASLRNREWERRSCASSIRI